MKRDQNQNFDIRLIHGTHGEKVRPHWALESCAEIEQNYLRSSFLVIYIITALYFEQFCNF